MTRDEYSMKYSVISKFRELIIFAILFFMNGPNDKSGMSRATAVELL